MDIYLGVGSNVGDRRQQLSAALAALAAAGVQITRVSPVVESPAMLPDDAPADWNQPFLNIVVAARTEAPPEVLLSRLKDIEARLGRVDRGRWAPRTIDLDILLYGREEIATEKLRVPHPGILDRAFVLAPLAALEPRLVIPGRGPRTVLEHARALRRPIPLWMGIVNVTPDSFSDGGEIEDGAALDARVGELVAAGTHIIDVGAESTRPGAAPLTADEEWARLEPVLGPLLDRYRNAAPRPWFSIDTYHPATARRALALGVDMINDVSGLTSPEMIELAGTSGKDWVAMHNLGVPADRERVLPFDRDPVESVQRWLEERITAWQAAGLDLARITFDPGIGFGKNSLQSMKLLRAIERFHAYGVRLLVGHSRKSFMHAITPPARHERDLFTLGASLRLCEQGVEVLRVHNVAAHAAAYRGWAHVVAD